MARSLVARLAALLADRYGDAAAGLGCDLALLCALVPGFHHALHADNAVIACPRHGADAAELRRLGCTCTDIEVRPNHTPWRAFTALLYLDDDHRGGEIVFGEGPGPYGRLYRQQIEARPGVLVMSPSNELYFHRTTPIEAGVRYSLNCWFTRDPARMAPEWR